MAEIHLHNPRPAVSVQSVICNLQHREIRLAYGSQKLSNHRILLTCADLVFEPLAPLYLNVYLAGKWSIYLRYSGFGTRWICWVDWVLLHVDPWVARDCNYVSTDNLYSCNFQHDNQGKSLIVEALYLHICWSDEFEWIDDDCPDTESCPWLWETIKDCLICVHWLIHGFDGVLLCHNNRTCSNPITHVGLWWLYGTA